MGNRQAVFFSPNLIYFYVCLGCICFFISQKAFSQEIQFYKEDLTFEIKDNRFSVSGKYYLRNADHTDRTITLIYPFPQDSLYKPVDTIFIYNMNKAEEIKPLEIKMEYSVFKIEMEAKESAEVVIYYSQELNACKAEYILTTTKSWKRGLEKASYQLISDVELNFTYFSYTPDSSFISGTNRIYYWERESFMPDKNFVFEFECD